MMDFYRSLHMILLILYTCVSTGSHVVESRKLFMMLVDGFRWDYFSLPGLELDGFARLIRSGVKAEYTIPEFPTNSFPNYRTIETGLHPENHGMVGNFLFDRETGGMFELGETPKSLIPHWWRDGEAFYITAEKQGLKTALYNWRGCQVEHEGWSPTLCVPFEDVPTMQESRWAMLDGLHRLKNNSADIVYVYHQQVDFNGHYHGPNSEEVLRTIQELDGDISDLLKNITELGLSDIDVILLSDHGMAQIGDGHVIDISEILDMSEILEITEGGTETYIWPQKGKEGKVVKQLRDFSRHYEVFDRSELHERWFLKKHRLMSPILLVAEPGWFVKNPRQQIFTKKPPKGNHGFDNDLVDMRAMFLAAGPSFKTNYIAKAFEIVNVYQMVCHVTGIHPRPHNGTWAAVKDMMVETEPLSGTEPRDGTELHSEL